MPIKQLFILCFLLFTTASFAQTGTVTGVVKDQKGETLPGVNVYVKSDPRIGTYTDGQGKYSLELNSDTDYILVFSFIAGKSEERPVNVKFKQVYVLNVELKSIQEIGEATVGVDAERQKPMKPLNPRMANQIPTPRGGIEDVLLSEPVNFSSELSSSYSVRGGSFDENLVYVNDIEVYRPFLVRAGQQEGLSFPNQDMVETIDFSAGGFESKYGDRMSSVLDIQYRRPKEFGGSAMLSLLGASLQFDGITKNKKFTHNTGFRYRRNSYILGTLDVEGDYNPTYTDLQTYLTYTPKEYGNWEFAFLGNIASNQYNFVPSTRQTNLGNINEALRLTVYYEGQEVTQFQTYFGALSTRYFASEYTTLKFIVSAFRTFEEEHFSILGEYFLDELDRDLGSDEFGDVLRNRGTGGFLDHARNDLDATVIDFTHRGNHSFEKQGHFLEWGGKVRAELINDRLSEWSYLDSAGYASPRQPDSVGYTNPALQPQREIYLHDVVKAENSVRSNRIMGYVQDSYEWRNAKDGVFTANLGVRANYWTFNKELVFGPRANFSYKPKWERIPKKGNKDTVITKDIVFTLAGGYYFQPAFYREMRDFDGQINQNIRAQRAIHVVLGADYLFYGWGRPFKLRGEIYYKDLNNLIPYEVENVRLRYYATNNSVGYATGIDVMLNGEFVDGVQSWFRASVLKTEEDILDDFYYEYYNEQGNRIIPGYTLDDTPVDSVRKEPGFIPRPTDQRFTFSMVFQDEMPRWPEYKVMVSFYFGSPLPFGPPTQERYKDVLRTNSYRRVDLGFSRDLVTEKSKQKKAIGWMESGVIALEIFNLLDIRNTINHTWIEDVNGRQYAIPNYLTGRRINLKLQVRF